MEVILTLLCRQIDINLYIGCWPYKKQYLEEAILQDVLPP